MRELVATRVTFEVAGHASHAPMIRASVAGTETTFVLDTGSTDHVWTMDLVERAGLRSSPAEPGTDHAGAATPTRAVGEVTIDIEALPVQVTDVVAIAGPSQFRGWGIGGFLSPQRLHPSAWVVIDMLGGRCALVEGETSEISTWLRDLHPRLRALTLQRESAELLVIQAAIRPFPPVATMLNTGTATTEFVRRAVPDLVGGPDEVGGRGVSGAEVVGQAVGGQVLRVGGAALEIPSLFVRDRMPEPPGIIGMDLLAGSVLAIPPAPSEPVEWLVAAD